MCELILFLSIFKNLVMIVVEKMHLKKIRVFMETTNFKVLSRSKN